MAKTQRWLCVATLASIVACGGGADVNALGPDLTDPRSDTTRTPSATDSAQWTFTGSPASPLPFDEAGWDVQVHSRDAATWSAPEPLQAHHASDCGPHPGTHAITRWDQVVYRCRDHIMTALRTDGYGAIILTPDRALQIGGTDAVVRFDLSTLRTSTRDWATIWLVPWADDLPVPGGEFAPDLNGPPRRAIAIEMTSNGNFCAIVYHDFESTELPCEDWQPLSTHVTPSATTRTPVEIRIANGRLRVGYPTLNVWTVDAALPASAAAITQAVVRLAHYSYTPGKCDGCSPGMTWHWDNLRIAPSRPFTITRGNVRAIRATTPTPVTFATASPAGAVLRFTTIGRSAEVSFDDGATWRAAAAPTVARSNDPIRPVVMALPTGTTRVLVRPAALITWWPNRDEWIAQDFAVWGAPR
ncbi:MAG: hypothetical protein IT353_12335 [Gemmatimonadaceae bacterium]|nr:hypothetical protein [Gemmatimonadaceae bacterium]